jgi:hypothetical protein
VSEEAPNSEAKNEEIENEEAADEQLENKDAESEGAEDINTERKEVDGEATVRLVAELQEWGEWEGDWTSVLD